MIIRDLKTHLYQEEVEQITQHLVGMELVFTGWVNKNWLNANQRQSCAMKKMNKVIVKESVIFYSKA